MAGLRSGVPRPGAHPRRRTLSPVDVGATSGLVVKADYGSGELPPLEIEWRWHNSRWGRVSLLAVRPPRQA